MTLPYGVISDPHYHRWDAFATTNADGLNSRLEAGNQCLHGNRNAPYP